MYTIDERDRVVKIETVPPPSIGAPIPAIVSYERDVRLAYYLDRPPGKIAVIEFQYPRAHMIGPPNDEALAGHPLYPRGLRPYHVFEVLESSWIRRLERMNRVHERHDPKSYEALRHYVFCFHDSTFECIAESLSAAEREGSITGALLEMVRGLGERWGESA